MFYLKRLFVLFALLFAMPATADEFREGLRAFQLGETRKPQRFSASSQLVKTGMRNSCSVSCTKAATVSTRTWSRP